MPCAASCTARARHLPPYFSRVHEVDDETETGSTTGQQQEATQAQKTTEREFENAEDCCDTMLSIPRSAADCAAVAGVVG
jgi:hypothetical protein